MVVRRRPCVVGMSSYAPVGPKRGLFDGAEEAPMREWLALIYRASTGTPPWIIAMFHAPWYNSNAGHFKEAERHRATLGRAPLYDGGRRGAQRTRAHAQTRAEPSRRSTGRARPAAAPRISSSATAGTRDPTETVGATRSRRGARSARALSARVGWRIHNATHATWEWKGRRASS